MVEYLGTQFEQAQETLNKAMALCAEGAGACSPKVEAQLHRDMGVVLITGLGQTEEGRLQFAQALSLEPSVQLDADLATDEVKEIWAEVKAEVAGGGGTGAEPEAGGAAPSGLGAIGIGGEAVEGDLIHTAPTEGAIQTPLPLYAELPEGVATPKMKLSVRYRTFGAERWKTIEMDRHAQGYAAEIPCADISNVTGELKYYIQATEGGDLVAFSGSRVKPHRVMIKRLLDGEPPRLPGKPPPAQCSETGDVPDCFDDEDCGDYAICDDGVCKESGDRPSKDGAPLKKNVLSVTFQMDMLSFPSETTVCRNPLTPGYTEGNYTCFFSDGTQYVADPDPLYKGNSVNGGFGMATMRVLLGYDRAIWSGLRLGARVGFAFGGGPKSQTPAGSAFNPIHVEGRAGWWFVNKQTFFQPYAMLSGGMMQVDGKVIVIVHNPDDGTEFANQDVNLEAWNKTGLQFVSLGAGALLALSSSLGAVVEVKAGMLFPKSGTFFALALGPAFSF